MKFAAPAKINLALHVTGLRPDGYHLIESLVVFADVGDIIAITPAEPERFYISGPFATGLVSGITSNLVVQARDALRAAAGSRPCPPVSIGLEKQLPIASGIGGGSADAAATLKGLNEHWQLGLTIDELCAIGLPFGADVPMCLHSKPLIARGVGEEITLVDTLPELHLLLVNPGVGVSTAEIFKRLVTKENGSLPSPPTDGSLISWLQTTRNDLETPARALCPAIGDVLVALYRAGALFARMSGSGATCFGIFEDQDAKASAKAAIAEAHPDWWIA